MIGNKELQKKVGNKVAEMANDKETQKKVATGVITVGKGALKGGKFLGKVGINSVKLAYGEMKNSNPEENQEEVDEE